MDITLNELTHEYKVDGQVVPSVTQIIQDILPIDLTYFKEEHRRRGHAVHAACHFLEENDLNWKTVHPDIIGYIKAWEKFMSDTGWKSEKMESFIAHKRLRYAGRLDRVGSFNNKKGVLDLKTGTVEHASLQLAGYAMAYDPIDYKLPHNNLHRWAVKLNENGTYKLHTYSNDIDFEVFEAMTKIYHYKRSVK